MVAELAVGPPDAHQREGLSDLVAGGAEQLKRLLGVAKRVVVAGLAGEGQGEAEVSSALAGGRLR
ncbi:hypothetical protein GCM10023074_34420 [Microbispora amethystogenes]|uniref:Uncharacterized protein n=1 Tax=Microbispora amethystogenes TaxID=1427754 RepID=A0ABQ4FAP2_9ACTN|nr:hypothetical protein Mam01_20600 [Microbispora amethystogenes]